MTEQWWYRFTITYFDEIEGSERTANGFTHAASAAELIENITAYYGKDISELHFKVLDVEGVVIENEEMERMIKGEAE